MTRPLKALTLRHPWPWAIITPGLDKDVENRTREPHPSRLRAGEWFAVHGGKAPASRGDLEDVADEAREVLARFPGYRPESLVLADVIRPGVVAVVRFGGCVTSSPSPWFEGPVGWVLADKFVLPEPVPCKGSQGLWDVPADVAGAVRAQYRAAREEAS